MIVTLYFLGFVLAFSIFLYVLSLQLGELTVGDCIFCVLLSVGSWASVIAGLVVLLIEFLTRQNKVIWRRK